MKKMVQIVSGSFSEKGNFSGYSTTGERIHLSAQQMENLGYKKDAVVAFPFFVIAVERSFNKLDENSNPVVVDGVEQTFTRVQAGSAFKTKEEMIGAFNSDKVFDIEATAQLKAIATDAGLTQAVIDTLVTVL